VISQAMVRPSVTKQFWKFGLQKKIQTFLEINNYKKAKDSLISFIAMKL